MNKHTLRLLLKWSIPVNVVLMLFIVADYFLWQSEGMAPLLVLYAVYVVYLIILLLLGTGAAYVRLPDAGTEPRTTIIYRRDR